MKATLFLIAMAAAAPGYEATKEWNATGGVVTDNCELGSSYYDSCIATRQNIINRTNANTNLEPASGSRVITGTNNVRIETTGSVSPAGTVANPAQR